MLFTYSPRLKGATIRKPIILPIHITIVLIAKSLYENFSIFGS
ncbi:MAG: hypothetical protein SPF27_06300 [Methanobrevibacter boviskoreani]|nr:hypothetical protein [Methanobrevibacter boviskoreani]MDD6256177.1 hypothetical protein [Methanobrevibacter boviskoreani]MDY5614892.1 hypothetical protein [Methanobrevibacter boviskoreani]